MGSVIGASGTLQKQELSSHWPDSLQIKFFGTVLACRCATSWLFPHGGIMGVPLAVIRAPGILRTLEFGNHWADSPKIIFIGIALACTCETTWSFGHGGIMGVPMGMSMGMMTAPGILRTLRLSSHLADSLKITCFGTVLACRCATSWSFTHGGIMGMPKGMIKALGILWTPELSNHSDSLEIKFIGSVVACKCNNMVICPPGPHGRNKHPWYLVHRAGDAPVICLLLLFT